MEVKEPESLESQGASACHPEGSVVSEEKRPVPAASETPCFFPSMGPLPQRLSGDLLNPG